MMLVFEGAGGADDLKPKQTRPRSTGSTPAIAGFPCDIDTALDRLLRFSTPKATSLLSADTKESATCQCFFRQHWPRLTGWRSAMDPKVETL